MKQLIIIGARGFGREVYSLAKRAIGYNTEFTIKGFLDDKKEALEGFESYPAILGSVESYKISENEVFICALGSTKWKKHYADIILAKGGNFINLIEQSVIVNENVKLGVGCIISENCIISNDVVIGNFTTVHSFSIFGHDVQIGDYVHIGAYCFFGGFSIVEDEVSVFVRATVLDRLHISKQAVIGAGSLVLKNIKEGITVFGNPAKKIEF